LVVVVGGSLGSAVLNRAVEHVVARHRTDRTLAIVHVAGGRDSVDLAEQISAPDGIWYRREVFIDAVADLYAAADLLVGRGGASTVHEVAATGTPAILVPWSAAAEDHQRANVRWLSDRGGALLIDDGDPAAVSAAVDELLGDVGRRSALGQSAWEIGSVNRSAEMAVLIDTVALA
jgi:UDP-N-acetylglucosamine--N-acetylmuramyl-(pentapeptide) pyrophosphoryl-undecaprenol N-acetylglucosamine transferase